MKAAGVESTDGLQNVTRAIIKFTSSEWLINIRNNQTNFVNFQLIC